MLWDNAKSGMKISFVAEYTENTVTENTSYRVILGGEVG